MSKAPKLTGPEEVALFISQLDHPLKKALEEIREIILSADSTLTEHIKWKAPSFCHNGDDRVTMNLHKSDCVMLVFHRGAKVKDTNGKGRLIADNTGLLEWAADDRAIARFFSVEEVQTKKPLIVELVQKWVAAAGLPPS